MSFPHLEDAIRRELADLRVLYALKTLLRTPTHVSSASDAIEEKERDLQRLLQLYDESLQENGVLVRRRSATLGGAVSRA